MAQVQALGNVNHDNHPYEKGEVFEVSDVQARDLVEAGAVSTDIDEKAIPRVDGSETDPNVDEDAPTTPELDRGKLLKKTRAQLDKVAVDNGIDTTGAETKADVVDRILDTQTPEPVE